MTNISWLSTPCCRSPLLLQAHNLLCQTCKTVYPCLNDNMPILVQNPQEHLAQTAMALKKELQIRIERLLQFKKHIKNNPSDRTEHLTQLQRAYEHNTQLLSSIISSIPMTSGISSLEDDPSNVSYNRLDTCLNYLRRDWGSNAASQEEMTIIKSRVIQLIKTYCDTPKTALIPGAGLGRFAHDLSPLFENTLAVEHSITMGYFYHKIQQQDINFYNIRLKNTQHNAQQYEQNNVSRLYAAHQDHHAHKLTYAIADARYLPMENQSVSAIISIYFTDVLPWSQLWPEVMRVLKPGGVFIHYGPLQYHFKMLHEQYSADDLRIELRSQGFELYDEQWDKLGHLSSSHSQNMAYNNWSFAARRPAACSREPVPMQTLDSSMSFNLGHTGEAVN